MLEIYDEQDRYVGRVWSYSGLCIEHKVDALRTMSVKINFTPFMPTYSPGSYDDDGNFTPFTQFLAVVQDGTSRMYLDEDGEEHSSTAYANLGKLDLLMAGYDVAPEYSIRTEHDWWIVKKVSGDREKGLQVQCVLDTRLLRRSLFAKLPQSQQAALTIDERWRNLRTSPATWGASKTYGDMGVYWSVDGSAIDRSRAMNLEHFSQADYLAAMCVAYMCEARYDTLARSVTFAERLGQDRGEYMRRGFTVSAVSKTSDAYDLRTVIVPVGKNGLTIQTVSGSEYSGCAHAPGSFALTNFDYTDRVEVYRWSDESYTDAEALAEDAGRILSDLCRPAVSYSVTPLGVQKNSDGTFDTTTWEIGDTVTIVDALTGTYDKQRIVGMKEYPQSPEKNNYELASVALTWEQIQSKAKAAAEIVDDRTTTAKITVREILDRQDDSLPGLVPFAAAAGYTAIVQDPCFYRRGDHCALDFEIEGTFAANQGHQVIGHLTADFPIESQVRLPASTVTYNTGQVDSAYVTRDEIYVDNHGATATSATVHLEWII